MYLISLVIGLHVIIMYLLHVIVPDDDVMYNLIKSHNLHLLICTGKVISVSSPTVDT